MKMSEVIKAVLAAYACWTIRTDRHTKNLLVTCFFVFLLQNNR